MIADMEQTEKIIPLNTWEIALCQYVCELVFGVDVFDLDLWVQIDPVKQPIERDFVGSANMSHCWAPAFDDHLDHRFIVFENVKHHLVEKISRLRKHDRHWTTRSPCPVTEFLFVYWCVCLTPCYAAGFPALALRVCIELEEE